MDQLDNLKKIPQNFFKNLVDTNVNPTISSFGPEYYDCSGNSCTNSKACKNDGEVNVDTGLFHCS
eukprot:Pgem_evm1s7800